MKIDIFSAVLGQPVIKEGWSGAKFAIWDISHRKAVNALIRAGWSYCGNPAYIRKGDDDTTVARSKPVRSYTTGKLKGECFIIEL